MKKIIGQSNFKPFPKCGLDSIPNEHQKEISMEWEIEEQLLKSTNNLSGYIPNLNDPVKIVCVNFHFFQEDDGSGNFDESDMDDINQLFDWCNGHFIYVGQPSDVINPTPQLISDTRIRLQLNTVQFYQDSVLSNHGNNVTPLQTAAFNRNQSFENQLNIYLRYIDFSSSPIISRENNSYVGLTVCLP